LKIEGFNVTPEAESVAPVASPPFPTTPSQPAISPTTSASRQESLRRTAPPSSFKLKEAIAEIPVPDAPREVVMESPVNVSSDVPFDLAAVTAALTRFVPVDGGVAMHAALTSYPPALSNGNITLKLDNGLLLAKAKEICPSLLAFLKQELGNGSITVQLELCDEEQESTSVKRLYTAKDKFDHFLAMNSAVQELKERFLLELP
jgi:hypothetical protein